MSSSDVRASRRPYEAPELIRVHVDPVKELLLQTPCNPQPGSAPGGGRLCEPPVCRPQEL